MKKNILYISILLNIIFIILYLYNNIGFDNKSKSAKEFNTIFNSIKNPEEQILNNTILSFPDYVNSYGILRYSFEQKIYEILQKRKLSKDNRKELSQYFYLIRVDVHDLKLLNFDENIGIDKPIYNYINRKLNEEEY